MRVVVGLFEAVGGEVGVDLGGDEVFVPEQFLHAAQIGAAVEQMGGEAVPQLVWRELGIEPGDFQIMFEVHLDQPRIQRAKIIGVGEKHRHLAGGRMLESRPVPRNSLQRGLADGQLPFLLTFAVHAHEALGDQLTCIFVDTGLMRAGEAEEVVTLFRGHYNVPLVHRDASALFLGKLAGVTDPEQKRKIIGGTFIDVFDEEAHKIGGADFLAQGTLYPDVIESVSFTGGPSLTIKSHHNVGGLPARMRMKLVEPLRELFKDEVRDLGRELGLPDSLVKRHPFPGPGLAIRIPGEITDEKLEILRKADVIYLDEIRNAGLYDAIWQAFAVLLPVRTVGVMGDGRTYDYVCALRAVTSTDGMTADSYPFDHAFLARVATRIINEVRGINRVVYDVTSKPPGTIEWE